MSVSVIAVSFVYGPAKLTVPYFTQMGQKVKIRNPLNAYLQGIESVFENISRQIRVPLCGGLESKPQLPINN